VPESTPAINAALPLQVYESAFSPPPPVAAWPLDPSVFEEHLNKEDALITFTAMVPLEELVHGDIDSLVAYCEQAFKSIPDVELISAEFRTVPNDTAAGDDWDERFQGDVAIQVTGALVSG